MIFTVRKRSCGKVMYLHLSVSNSVHGGCIPACTGQTPPPQNHTLPETHLPLEAHSLEAHPPWKHTLPEAHTHTPEAHPPPDDHCSGQYASYWNAFLFIIKFTCKEESLHFFFTSHDCEISLLTCDCEFLIALICPLAPISNEIFTSLYKELFFF